MKRLLLIVTVLAATSTMFAQFKIGGGGTLGTLLSSNQDIGAGLNIRANYSFNEKFTLSTGYTYVIPSHFANNRYTSWQINGDLHYNYLVKEKYSLYGLAGINYTQQKTTLNEVYLEAYEGIYSSSSTSTSIGETGINIGLGATFKKYFGEVKYDSSYGQVALSLGFIF